MSLESAMIHLIHLYKAVRTSPRSLMDKQSSRFFSARKVFHESWKHRLPRQHTAVDTAPAGRWR